MTGQIDVLRTIVTDVDLDALEDTLRCRSDRPRHPVGDGCPGCDASLVVAAVRDILADRGPKLIDEIVPEGWKRGDLVLHDSETGAMRLHRRTDGRGDHPSVR